MAASPSGLQLLKRAVCPPVAASLPTLTCANLDPVRPARGDVARLPRGWGRADLHSWAAPQRAGPTAHKIHESNRVLTRRLELVRFTVSGLGLSGLPCWLSGGCAVS
ncbi:hypothetical protein HMPREF3198_00804 [Winkia neuii]|nr:hypothetical protein HMPREF3198_00804 [Winkia neuii]